MLLIWIALALVVVIFLFVGYVFRQYHKIRKDMPRPAYKVPTGTPSLPLSSEEGLSICWVGHSTLYIVWNGVHIVTDPVFSERIGVKVAGLWTIGPRRHTAPAVSIADIANKVDLVLLSHAHMDHLDVPSLKQLARADVEVVTAVGTHRLVENLGFGRVSELGGTDSLKTASGVTLTAVPVRHWGARFPWNRDYQWTGYVLEHCGRRVFYAGDTAFTPTFADLPKTGPIDVACIPIGAYAPDSFQGAHCTPEQAWRMFRDCGAAYMIPIHWDTFVLSHEPVEEPMERLLGAAGDDADRIVIRQHGGVFALDTALPHS